MGSGASASIAAATEGATDDQLKEALAGLGAEEKSRLLAALGGVPAAPPVLGKSTIEEKIASLPEDMRAIMETSEFDEECKSEFAKADTNSNGAIDGFELVLAVTAVVPADYREKMNIGADNIAQVILSFDKNADGKIQVGEFKLFCMFVLACHLDGTFS